eukprot:scaffold28448_cov73-Isochrysis_galbana.AAC.1
MCIRDSFPGLHLAAQARRLLPALRHDLHHPVCRPAHALPARDRAQARVGCAGGASAQLLQDDRQAHVRRANADSYPHPHPHPHPNHCYVQ